MSKSNRSLKITEISDVPPECSFKRGESIFINIRPDLQHKSLISLEPFFDKLKESQKSLEPELQKLLKNNLPDLYA